jgi:hypothetical protein
MHQLKYDPENGYVENFLFGKQIEVHSSLGDMWVYAGLLGVLFGVVCIVVLSQVVGRRIAERAAGGLVLFVVIQSFWNMFFNPLQGSAAVLVLALGLGLVRRTGTPAFDGHEPELDARRMHAV